MSRRFCNRGAIIATLVILPLLAGCTSFVVAENGYSDLLSPLNGPLNGQRKLESLPLSDLACCAPSGLREYEIGRRFEQGTGGVPQDRDCAVSWYQVAASKRTTVLERDSRLGIMSPITYLGVPQARRALRRLDVQQDRRTNAPLTGCSF